MRTAPRAVLPFVAAGLLLSSCGGGSGQATRPPDPGTLLSEAAAAASGEHSARFQLIVKGTLLLRRSLPAAMPAGPYGIAVRGAATSADGGLADVTVDIREPGATARFAVREIGTTVYLEPPGGRWYRERVGGLATRTPGSDRASAIAGRFLVTRAGDWLGGVGARRAGPTDAIDGELDVNAISSDVAGLLERLHAPRRDIGLARYVTESLQTATWTLTFDHGSHLLEGMHARAAMEFRPDILRAYGLGQPFGLPRAADGLTITLAAHITHWGESVHVTPPKRATPLPTPGLPAPAI